jgi:hypothetical protein
MQNTFLLYCELKSGSFCRWKAGEVLKMKNRRLCQMLRVRVFVEANEQRFANAGGGRAEVAGWSEQDGKQFGVRRFLLFHVERHDIFPFRRNDSIRLSSQRQRLGFAQTHFRGVNSFLGRFGLDVLKVPLSLLTGRSGFAVVQPVNHLRHDESSLVGTRAV